MGFDNFYLRDMEDESEGLIGKEKPPEALTEEGEDKLFELRFQVRREDCDKLHSLLSRYAGEVQDTDHQKTAIEELRDELQALTSSIHWKPKLLNFVEPYYGDLKACYDSMDDSDSRKHLADILSVLAQTTSSPEECIKYRLLGSGDVLRLRGSADVLRSWGPGYVMQLKSELLQECRRLKCRRLEDPSVSADHFGHLGHDISLYFSDMCGEQDKDMVFILNPYCCDCGGDCEGNCRDCGIDSVDDCVSDSEDDCGSDSESDCGSECESDSTVEQQIRDALARRNRTNKVYEQLKKIDRFDGDLIMIDGVRAFPTYGPDFSFHPATHRTREEHNHFDELAKKLARDVCEYNNCIKDVDQQLVFKHLIKAIVYPRQCFFITLEATNMGNLKIVQAEVRYGWFYTKDYGVEFIIGKIQPPFDQGPANCVSLKDPFA
ncbi:hypothetical protein Tsubulata_030645 [Turnera subulata]|uniref:RPN1 N-terminal domain-containing protein n=1 Tax=Turnera subulata TaxID=218843 RepID=A0A9Q0FE33_9ROSI|nr:hypothetical protein Tsubulata_030645 [Turnera subulata]